MNSRPNRPERLYHVSQSQLSVARFYGGCKFNGANYHYDASTDTLIRMDIWLAEKANIKRDANEAAKAEREKWMKAQRSFAEFSNATSHRSAACGASGGLPG